MQRRHHALQVLHQPGFGDFQLNGAGRHTQVTENALNLVNQIRLFEQATRQVNSDGALNQSVVPRSEPGVPLSQWPTGSSRGSDPWLLPGMKSPGGRSVHPNPTHQGFGADHLLVRTSILVGNTGPILCAPTPCAKPYLCPGRTRPLLGLLWVIHMVIAACVWSGPWPRRHDAAGLPLSVREQGEHRHTHAGRDEAFLP